MYIFVTLSDKKFQVIHDMSDYEETNDYLLSF